MAVNFVPFVAGGGHRHHHHHREKQFYDGATTKVEWHHPRQPAEGGYVAFVIPFAAILVMAMIGIIKS